MSDSQQAIEGSPLQATLANEMPDLTDTEEHAPKLAPIGLHQASMRSSILNLIKNILATSMLTMPYGTSLSGVLPSIIICVVIGTLSWFTFALLGLLCGKYQAHTYTSLCEKLLGKKWSTFVDVVLAGYTLPCCIGYVCFVCDCMHQMLFEIFDGQQNIFISRWFIGIVVTVFILFPLCSTDKIQALTYTSLLGIGALVYCYIFVAMDLADQDEVISKIENGFWKPPNGSVLCLFPIANIYAAAFLVHYNSPKYYDELVNPTRRRLITLSFSAGIFVMIFCASFAALGFARFGQDTPPNLLTGYTSAYAAWITTSVSLITTYPFDFDGGRRSVINLIRTQNWLADWSDKKLFWASTIVMIPAFSTVAVFIPDISFVIGINGCLFGITTGFTIPGLVFHKAGLRWGLVVTVFGLTMSLAGLVSIFVRTV